MIDCTVSEEAKVIKPDPLCKQVTGIRLCSGLQPNTGAACHLLLGQHSLALSIYCKPDLPVFFCRSMSSQQSYHMSAPLF